MLNRAVFLDLDGTLVAMTGDHGPRRPSEVRLLPGVVDGCLRLREASYLLFLVTNQPDIARGKINQSEYRLVLDGVIAALGLTEARICPHDDHDHCCCRKPKPGLIYAIACERGIALSESWYIGDSGRDRGAAAAAGVSFLQVRHDRSFAECVKWILRN